MHNHYNRDKYVTIHWENIEPGIRYAFRKYNYPEQMLLDSNYDFYSIMHYGTHQASKNGFPTIVPKVSKQL